MHVCRADGRHELSVGRFSGNVRDMMHFPDATKVLA
jgi:hypothetical protein